MIDPNAANALSAVAVLVFLSFLVARADLQSFFFTALGRKLFLGHWWMRELINHLVLRLTLKGIPSTFLYLLSAREMRLSAGNGRPVFYRQGETSDPKCSRCFYLESIFARCSTAALFVFSFSTCCLFLIFAMQMNENCVAGPSFLTLFSFHICLG